MEFDYSIDTDEDMIKFLDMLNTNGAIQKNNCSVEDLKELMKE